MLQRKGDKKDNTDLIVDRTWCCAFFANGHV